MNKDLEAILYEAFPTVFGAGPRSGFSCGNGWFALIYKLAGAIEAHNAELPESEHIVATQVKEKFGGLRFYADGLVAGLYVQGKNILPVEDPISVWVREAERQSYLVCELCGRQGRVRYGRPWVRTLCDRCDSQEGCKQCSRYRSF